MSSPSPESPRPMTIPERRSRNWIWFVVAGVAALVVLGGALIALAVMHRPAPSTASAPSVTLPASSPAAGGAGGAPAQPPTAAVTANAAAPVTVRTSTTGSATASKPVKPAAKKPTSKKKPKTAAPAGSILPAGSEWVLRHNDGRDYNSGQLALKPGIVTIYATVMRTNHKPLSAMWRTAGGAYHPWWSVASAVNGQTHRFDLTVSKAGNYQFAVKCLPGASWALRVMWKKAG